MVWSQKENMNNKTNIKRLLVVFVAIIFSMQAKAQDPTDSLPDDPGAIYVYTIQDLQFGSFVQGSSGGTITVSNAGVRSTTGTVLLLNQGSAFFEAIIDVEAAEGSLISITNGADVTLTGSNGGTMLLHIGNPSPGSPFNVTVSPPATTSVHIGGTLTVGNSGASPPGTYSGIFYVTFNQE